MSQLLRTSSLLFICLGLLSACGGEKEITPESTRVRPAVPAEYMDLENPVEGNPEAQSSGEEIFQIHCMMCHGEKGEGNGPAGASLRPKPGDIAASQKNLNDAYLYWRIAEGGMHEPFSSAMPSWKSILSEEEIWQVITYIRTLEKPGT